MKILCADDDKDLLALIAFTLSQAGYLVISAGDGASAIRSFESEAPDLVILDINMPGATGFQVCEAIRAQSRVPVMMLTVRGEEEDLVRALELGADDYMTKPFSPRTLLARVKALLRRAGLENSAPLAAGRQRRSHRELGSLADAGVGSQRGRRPPAAQAARPPAATESRSGSRRAAD